MSLKNHYLFQKLLQAVAVVMVLLTTLPYLFYKIWWIDIFANFHVQYLVVLLLLIVVFAINKKVKWVLLLLVAIVFSSTQIFPLYVNASAEAKTKPKKTISIASINLLSTNTDTKLVVDFIENKNPQILVLSELTARWDNELEQVLKKYNYHHKLIREDNFGIGVWSKLPAKMETIYFSEYQVPSILLKSETSYSLIATHPFPPVGQRQFEIRNKQLAGIATYLQEKS